METDGELQDTMMTETEYFIIALFFSIFSVLKM